MLSYEKDIHCMMGINTRSNYLNGKVPKMYGIIVTDVICAWKKDK